MVSLSDSCWQFTHLISLLRGTMLEHITGRDILREVYMPDHTYRHYWKLSPAVEEARAAYAVPRVHQPSIVLRVEYGSSLRRNCAPIKILHVVVLSEKWSSRIYTCTVQ